MDGRSVEGVGVGGVGPLPAAAVLADQQGATEARKISTFVLRYDYERAHPILWTLSIIVYTIVSIELFMAQVLASSFIFMIVFVGDF